MPNRQEPTHDKAPGFGTAYGVGVQSPPAEPINEENIDRIEQQTVKEVSRAITVLESALAQWNGLDKKPHDLEPEFERYKSFHDALEQWETKALRSIGKAVTFEERIDRLREFVSICNSHT